MAREVNKHLSKQQKAVLFDKATEPPFSGKYLDTTDDGEYACVNCGQIVFDATTKFDSGCGWPSFYDVKRSEAVKLLEDRSQGLQRVEVICSNCDGHLGHVFNDAPGQPTGMRFCINSVSLDFKHRK